MKKLVILIAFLLAGAIGCKNEQPTPVNNTVAVIEGTVAYFPPTAAIGGESDPFGFILTAYHWVNGAPSFSHSRVYLRGAIDSSYLNMRVRASGRVEVLSAGGVETPLRHFPSVEIQRLEILQ
jgi:hypothetical protein